MHGTRWQALSYSIALSPLLTTATPTHLAILSTHPHAWNLCTAAGQIIALIDPRYDNGPFHIVVPPPFLSRLPTNTAVHYQTGILSLHNIELVINKAVPWDPHLPLLQVSPADALFWLHETKSVKTAGICTGPTAQVLRAQSGISSLAQGITRGDTACIHAGVVGLAGLGPGLTPAGDDFLVGLLAALHATTGQSVTPLAQRQLALEIAAIAAPRTTRLSAAWLMHGGRGHFGARWHHLIMALNRLDATAIKQAVTKIEATGATSGADGLYGFVTALAWMSVDYFNR